MDRRLDELENQLTATLNNAVNIKARVYNLVRYSDLSSKRTLKLEEEINQAVTSLSKALKSARIIEKEISQ